MEKLVYLGGPIEGLSYKGCTDWRKSAIEELAREEITGISPMRGKDFLEDHALMVEGAYNHILTCDSGITTRDMWDVRRSDVVLFNLLNAKQVSTGSMIEYGWGSAFNKPIITVMEKEGNLHDKLMVRRLSGYRVETLEEGLMVVKALFAY